MMKQKYKDKYKPLDLEFEEENNFAIIKCPNCNCEITSANINLNNQLAKCDNCNAISSIKDKVVELQSNDIKEEIAKPVGIDILEYNDQLELTLNQPVSITHTISASISPLFGLIAIGIYSDTGNSLLVYLSLAFLFSFVYSLIHLIRYKKNKIYVTVTKDHLAIEYRPNNFIKDKFYNVENIEQLFVKKDHNGLNLQMTINESRGQKTQKLIGRFTDITKAKYIEQEIERYLDISNKKVSGEEM